MKVVVETKPFRPPELNESKNSTNKKKVQAPRSKKYKGKKDRTKSQCPEPKVETDFKVWCSDLEVYIFDLGPRASDKFSTTMKDLER